MTNHPNRWTVEDDELLRELWEANADGDEIAEALGRSKPSVFTRAAELGLPRRSAAVPWTRAELDTLCKLFERGMSDTEIAARLDNRSISAVVRQRANLGLVRRPDRRSERPMMAVAPAKTCQWIEGDPKEGDYTMCGKPSVEGRSYCAGHARRAYVQPGTRKPPKKEWREPLRRAGRV